jgi:hypothetical protein
MRKLIVIMAIVYGTDCRINYMHAVFYGLLGYYVCLQGGAGGNWLFTRADLQGCQMKTMKDNTFWKNNDWQVFE